MIYVCAKMPLKAAGKQTQTACSLPVKAQRRSELLPPESLKWSSQRTKHKKFSEIFFLR